MNKQQKDLRDFIIIGFIAGCLIGAFVLVELLKVTGVDQDKFCEFDERKLTQEDVRNFCYNNNCYGFLNCQNIHDKIYLCNAK